nr:MFS transporter [Effusibacillus dendaii]
MMKDRMMKTHGHSRIEMVLLIVGIVLVASNLRASLTTVGPLIGAIVSDTGLSNALAGLLTTLPLIAFAVLSLLAPKIARLFGMEYTLLASLIVLTAGIILRSLPSVVALFIGTGVLGLAIAVGNVLLPSLVKREFPNCVGLMTGVYSMSMNIWGAIASGVSVPIAQGFSLGWRRTLMCWAIFSAVAVIVWFPQLRFRHQPSPYSGAKGRELWGSRLAWQVTLFMGLQSLGFYAAVAWIPEMLHDRGISISTAGWMLSLMQFVSLPVTFIIPVLAGRLSNQRGLVTIIALLYLVGYAGLLMGGTRWISLWIILIGIGQGASISLALTFISLRASNADQAAELSGMAQSIGYLLAAVGPVLFGFLHDLTHAWTISILLLMLASVFQLIVGLGAGRNAQIAPLQSFQQDVSKAQNKKPLEIN